MGTFTKSFGSVGGYIAGDRVTTKEKARGNGERKHSHFLSFSFYLL
jgi:7-keto-8-aminopelargonate synthetase-like enzyme